MKKLNIRQEKFCQYYVKSNLFGNATQCYAKVYKFDLNDKENGKKNIHICEVNGFKLLSKAEINSRVRELLNEMLTDEIVDSELSKIMLQDQDLNVKLGALKEYNKLKARITEHSEVKVDLPQPIYALNELKEDKLPQSENKEGLKSIVEGQIEAHSSN